jgi:DNA repair protein RecO (recombination protein O)
MPARVSESIVLRTYPLQESDLIVSFLTRDAGKLRGVAKRARRPKSSFGASLERLSHTRIYYFAKESRELVSIDSCELLDSPFDLQSDYSAMVALDYFAEVTEHLMPPAEPAERHFRLLLAVIDHIRHNAAAGVWPAIHYFTYWAVRLAGFFPEMRVSEEARLLAHEMAQLPVAQLSPRTWSRSTAADLRRTLVQSIEEHVERRLVTTRYVESL